MTRASVVRTGLVMATMGSLLVGQCVLGDTARVADEGSFASKRVSLQSEGVSLPDALAVLSEQTRVPVSYEENMAGSSAPKQTPARPVNLANVRLGDALDRVCALFGAHVWKPRTDRSGANVIPSSVYSSKEWLLNRKCPGFAVTDATVSEAVSKLNEALALGDARIAVGCAFSIAAPSGSGADEHPMLRLYNGRQRVTVTVKAGTVRDVLNQIARAAGEVWWYYRESVRPNGSVLRMLTFYPVVPRMIGEHVDADAR